MPLLNTKLARLQAAVPQFLRIRSSRLPLLAVIAFLTFTLYRYSSDPTNFNLLDILGLYAEDDDYYDPHLYEWHKYPGAARAGAHQEHEDHAAVLGKKKVDGPGMDGIGQDHFQDGHVNYTEIDGLVRGWTLQGRSKKNIGKRLVHPIEELMAQGKTRWEDLLRRQSRTLEQAVREYKRRYGRLPPKGFDLWWAFCQENDVKIVDDVSSLL
jgi:hypothetical protein